MWRVGGVIICCMLSGMVSATNNQETIQNDQPEDDGFFSKLTKQLTAMFPPVNTYEDTLYLRLISKDWKPNLSKVPENDDLLPSFPGPIEDVEDTFKDPENNPLYHERPFRDALELLSEEYGYNSTLESIFFIRPVPGKDMNEKNFMSKNILLSVAMRNMRKRYNWFTVETDFNSETAISTTMFTQYFAQRTNYHEVAETISRFLTAAAKEDLLKIDRVHIVGFCYAAIVCGYVAQYVVGSTGTKLKSVLAMEPHATGLSKLINKVVRADDATVVYAYHTNSQTFGTTERVANVDIVFNGGRDQPGCGPLMIGCNHARALYYLWYIVIYPDKWLARKCNSWDDFRCGRCDGEETIPLTFPPEPRTNGVYYIQTDAVKPFGLGDKGAIGFEQCEDERKEIPPFFN